MQEEANDAKQSRRHDESGGTTRLAICPARRPPPREAAVEEAGRGCDLQQRSPYGETRSLGNPAGSTVVQQDHTPRVIQSDGQNRKLACT